MLEPEFVLFARLIFGLIIDLLIANGYLLPEQREQWVNGAVSVVGAAGAAILLAIYQYHSHKKDNSGGDVGFKLPNIWGFIFKPKTTTTTKTVETTTTDQPIDVQL